MLSLQLVEEFINQIWKWYFISKNICPQKAMCQIDHNLSFTVRKVFAAPSTPFFAMLEKCLTVNGLLR
jgi:hypothetical protein